MSSNIEMSKRRLLEQQRRVHADTEFLLQAERGWVRGAGTAPHPQPFPRLRGKGVCQFNMRITETVFVPNR
jgi:hypothetical protein